MATTADIPRLEMLQVADMVGTTAPPNEEELTVLRSLKPSETSNIGEMVTAAIGATG